MFMKLGIGIFTLSLFVLVPVSFNPGALTDGPVTGLTSVVGLSEACANTCSPSLSPEECLNECEESPFDVCNHTMVFTPIEGYRDRDDAP